ncbi:MAG: hypothetical protein IT444_06020 [Phycisphaeraceae bacterium]|nr:hypothetical protein [Phycisphaeraceae bacterium]
MKKYLTWVAIAVISHIALTASGLADSSANPTLRDSAAIRKEIEETQVRVAQLEREAAQADQREAEAQQLADLRNQAIDRNKAVSAELIELVKTTDTTLTQAQLAQRDARISFLKICQGIDEKITQFDGASHLPEAKSLIVTRDIAEARWAIVTAPTTDRSTRIESLEPYALESMQVRNMVNKLKQLHEQDIKDAEAEFILRQQRIRAAAEMEHLFEDAVKG